MRKGANQIVATTHYDYDSRGRLTHEWRARQSPYDFEYELVYEYDQGGNRTKKSDNLTGDETEYTYDYQDQATFDTKANRLMTYVTRDASQAVVSTTWYDYNEAGNVERVITSDGSTDDRGAKESMTARLASARGRDRKDKSTARGIRASDGGDRGDSCGPYSTRYTATRFEYAKNGETVTYVLGETWCAQSGAPCEDEGTYEITFAREFRYDGARQRYLNRVLNPGQAAIGNTVVVAETWSDYDGQQIYGDYTLGPLGVTETRSYEPGIGLVDDWTDTGSAATSYYHTDHLGTTRFMTDPAGAEVDSAVYTAFGERVAGVNHRYGYDGAWGYQSHKIDELAPLEADKAFPYLHVGHRYYDPSCGRFLQRDPIGIDGGLNVYVYAGGKPTAGIDPNGLDVVIVDIEVPTDMFGDAASTGDDTHGRSQQPVR